MHVTTSVVIGVHSTMYLNFLKKKTDSYALFEINLSINNYWLRVAFYSHVPLNKTGRIQGIHVH